MGSPHHLGARMLEGLSGQDVLGLLAATAALFFYFGRATAKASRGAQAKAQRFDQQSAADAFAGLPTTTQTQIDQLIAARKTIDAIKAVRTASGLGLYEAKQIVDLRKSERHSA